MDSRSEATRAVDAVESALRSDRSRRTLPFAAIASALAFAAAFAICLAIGRRDLAVASGLVAMFAVVGSSVVPPGLTLQVGPPAALAVLVTPFLVLASDRRPWVGALLMGAVMIVASISGADQPTGAVVGLMGAMTFTLGLASRAIHDVSWTDAAAASGIAAVVAGLAIALLAGWRRLGIKEHSRLAWPRAERLPGTGWGRYRAAVGPALRNWRTDAYVRLAVRRAVVLAPLAGVLVAWGDPNGLFALLAAFAGLQITFATSTARAIAQVAGTLVACLLAVLAGLVLSGMLLFALGIVGMAIGLTFVLRNPFIAAAGTTAFALAGAGMAGDLPTLAAGRITATVAGALLAVLGTLLVRPPRP